MKSYSHLSQEERYFISTLRARKISFRQIARELGRSTSTVTREFHRNLRPSGRYAACVAHSYASAKKRRSRRGSHLPPEGWKLIFDLLCDKWSPEQISHHLRLEGQFSISFQSIYRVLRKDHRKGGFLFQNLRIMPKRRRKRYGSLDSRGVLRGKRLISERPEYINDRSQLGHWEVDTVMGKDKHQCLLTLVERKSGVNRIFKLKNRTAKNVTQALIHIISAEADKFKTLTFDNGTEFHSYKTIEVHL